MLIPENVTITPPINLLDMTRHVHAFLKQHAPEISDHQHWQKAKSVVQHHYGIDALDWACALSDHQVRGFPLSLQDFDWFFNNPGYIHAPLSRISGYGSFYGRRFQLNAATLDPRWESQGLIDIILATQNHDAKNIQILDVGTGSGCLLITLLLAFPNALGWGLDCSPEALDMARQNAQYHGVWDRSIWMQSDGLDGFSKDSMQQPPHGWALQNHAHREPPLFDMVISNPPYIANTCALPDDVRLWDPALALYGGNDGLDCYRAWIGPMVDRLSVGGIMALEIGWDQGTSVQNLCIQAGLRHARISTDLDGCDRYVWAIHTHDGHPQ